MNKQIEEMAKDNKLCFPCKFWDKELFGGCYQGSNGKNCVIALKTAEALYNAGYCKVDDGNIGEFSDGYHTFNELYHHRAVLFSVICNLMSEKAWKSKLHDTGDMFDGMFIVGIETEQGQATYHYDIEPYWNMFNVKELDRAPKWDGHTPTEAIDRIGQIKLPETRKETAREFLSWAKRVAEPTYYNVDDNPRKEGIILLSAICKFFKEKYGVEVE